MKKLLIATDFNLPRWDGIARFLYEIIPRFSKHFEITLLAPNFKGKPFDFKNVKQVKFPLVNIQFADFQPSKPSLKKIKTILKDQDAVFVQNIGPIASLTVYAAKKLNKKIFMYTHSVEWEIIPYALKGKKSKAEKYIKRFTMYIYAKANLMFTPNLIIKKKYEALGIKTKKLIVPLGVDTVKFAPADNAKYKKKFRLPQDGFIVGFAGRVAKEKDLPTLFKAMEIVVKQVPNAKLYVVGSGITDYDTYMKEKPYIVNKGNVNNMEDHLKAMDLFVLPSLTETTSFATIEAMSTGLPCITTNVGFMVKGMKNGYNGLKFQKGNFSSLANKIIYLYKRPSVRKKLGINARNTIIKKLSWEITTDKIINSINSFLK